MSFTELGSEIAKFCAIYRKLELYLTDIQNNALNVWEDREDFGYLLLDIGLKDEGNFVLATSGSRDLTNMYAAIKDALDGKTTTTRRSGRKY